VSFLALDRRDGYLSKNQQHFSPFGAIKRRAMGAEGCIMVQRFEEIQGDKRYPRGLQKVLQGRKLGNW